MIGGAKGIGIGIDFGIPNQYCRATSKPYIEKDVLDSLRIVASAYGKSNDDADRSIVKNLVDPDNPFVISNAAYTEGSGYADKDSPYYGAFVTDGIDDLITSTKTVQEMLGGSTEFTAVSMIHLISPGQDVDGVAYTNYIRTSDNYWTSNRVSNVGKTGIYGYSFKQSTPTVINNILGDKGDYTTDKSSDTSEMFRANFSVEGFEHVISGTVHASSVAWYWTIIANKVLTTDQINQVIAYFNLDRTLNPDILCNTIKQGITNENHAEFGDKLIDFSGNGRDIQLNNIAWKGDSGIGKYEVDFLDSSIWNSSNSTITSSKIDCKNAISHIMLLYYSVGSKEYPDIPSFKVIKTGADIDYSYIDETGSPKSVKIVDGVNILPASHNTLYSGSGRFCGFGNPGMGNSVTITQIPSHAGGLCLDGVNDFGKVTGMPIYKDYTFISKYQRLTQQYVSGIGGTCLISKSYIPNQGSFIIDVGSSSFVRTQCYSFGALSPVLVIDNSISCFHYQTKYIFDKQTINTGEGIDSDTLWLGLFRDNDQRFFNGAIYSLMSFPYSMSEFLIERQLKKHKLGTLYPNMVEFRPVIKANANYNIFYTALLPLTGIVWEKINIGDYIPVGRRVAIQLSFDNEASELVSAISSQLGNISITKNSNNKGYTIFGDILKNKSPQKINITIDEYIRYEDIVQPYPVLLRFKDENSNEVSWGGKFRVGSTITRIGSFYENNLIDGLYIVRNPKLNGNNLITPTHVVEKSMVFTCDTEYLLDNNEPKCILSPRLLRIPNSSYKILGYIPDISGHGNHGVIHNSAYGEGSGVNKDGSYQFDGVDDHVTIPTLSSGGKQVLMKVNWDKTIADAILYDQRGYPNEFAIYNADVDNNNNPVFAYQARNNGQTYIDGILNKNIKASELRAITHNITITNELSTGTNRSSPVIGSNRVHDAYFTNMALYDFMLFDSISTDDKIKELNEYIGIEAKVELPPYYWDAYGKTNLDANKATIQQIGIAVGDYDITNYNHAYDKMSGYGGYEFDKFTNTRRWIETKRENGIEVIEKNDYSFTAKRVGTGEYFWDFKNNSIRTLDKELTVKAVSNNNVSIRWEFKYRTAEKPDTDSAIILLRQAMTPNVPITVILPYKTQEEQTELGVVEGSAYYLFYFDPSDIPVGDEYTVEMLPLYTNGLVYDGITDYSKNANIPALDDFTAIIKREWLKKQGCPLIKGSKVYEGGNGNALLLEWDKAYNFVFYKRTDIMEGELPDNISFITPTNYNGNVITRGSEQDTNGICIAGDGNAGFANMVFYKLILYPKTIPLLQINFLKNLMERDEIIDLTNKIFIQE